MAGQPDGETAGPRTNRLLISEPPLLVLPSLAVLIGLNEAIFLQQLHYWLQGKAAKERDDRPWVYNTYEEWAAQLPFWSVRTIRRIVADLETRGLVRSTTAYNAQKIDRTKWYTLDYAALGRLTERADHAANLAAWTGQDAQMDVANLAASVPETTPETTNRERAFENSKDPSLKFARYDDDRQLILRYLEDDARELNDQAPLGATTSRAQRLYQASGLSLDAFIQRMGAARAITQERTAGIKTAPVGAGPWPKKPKMAYFFAVLADLVGEGTSGARVRASEGRQNRADGSERRVRIVEAQQHHLHPVPFRRPQVSAAPQRLRRRALRLGQLQSNHAARCKASWASCLGLNAGIRVWSCPASANS